MGSMWTRSMASSDRSRKDYTEIFDMLLKWNEARKNGQADFDSSAAYEEWKLHYPPSIR